MGLIGLNSYIRTLRGMTKRGKYVKKSAEKELEVALKVRESLMTKIAVGDI